MVLFTLLKDKDFKEMLGKYPDGVVAKKFNVSQATVGNARRQLGIKPCCNSSDNSFTQRKLPEDIMVIRSDLEDLGSLSAVAKKYGVSRQAVSARMSREKK